MQLQPSFQPGDKIGGRYLVHQALMGGMGEVYLCLDLETIRPFALKTFQARYRNNQKFRDNFSREVLTWIALEKHPNIVRCYLMDILDDLPFMFLEWIVGYEGHGSDLRSWLRHGPIDPRQALDFAIDICRGLIHAGQKQPGIVHRDLKPENILVSQRRTAKITDFGLARIVQEVHHSISDFVNQERRRQHLVVASGVAGTPPYMAPEQWCAEKLDARTDIYAIGCILYEMLTGQRPFDAHTFDEFRRRHLEAPIPKLKRDNPLFAMLDRTLSRCLAKKREERFEAIANLLQELSNIYQQHFAEMPSAVVAGAEFTAADYSNRGATYSELQRF